MTRYALILACALLAAAAHMARAEPPPLTHDLAAAAKLAREQRVPVFVAFTLKQCPYCNRARREYWTPMHESAEWRAKTLMVEVMLDGAPALRDFDGSSTTAREFGKRYGIRSVPTVLVFDTQGTLAGEAVVGLASADFYGAYLERAIEQGLAKVRASRFTGTPDGRKGWVDFFVEKGYAVYIVDQPTRARSAWNESVGPLTRFSASQLEQRFTNAAQHKLWPQAALHTQWPGDGPKKGQRGDPVFDQFYASQVQYIGVNATVESKNREAGAALLDKIGPAIVLTHSQSGAVGWVIGDARPKLVKAIVAAEPTGPPFAGAVFDTSRARPYGITETPVAYDPPLSDPSQLVAVQQEQPDGPNLARCFAQGEPVRKLAHLSQIPIVILAAESSYHAVYDHCTAKYLTQAGVNTTFVRLEAVGIKGNGHMMMIEKNSLEIADFIDKWLVKTVR